MLPDMGYHSEIDASCMVPFVPGYFSHCGYQWPMYWRPDLIVYTRDVNRELLSFLDLDHLGKKPGTSSEPAGGCSEPAGGGE